MARLNAWLTPDVGTGETISRCLTFPRSLMPHVVGALSALTEVWRWEAYGDMSPADAAHLATIMLDQFESEWCTANVLLRQNPTNPCQLERSDDGGETWVMFADTSLCVSEIPETVEYPDDMRLDPVTGDLQYSLDGGETWSDYPTPTTPEPTQPYTPLREVPAGATDNEKRCAAATSAANALNQMYEQTYGAIAAGIANTWGAFSNFMNDLTDFVFGITYGQVWDIVKIIGLWDDIDFETNYAAATLGSEAIDALTCLIYDNTTIDQNGHSQIDFGAVRDNVISELGINPGTAVWTHLNYLQEAGLERIADVGFGTTDCSGSGCVDIDWDCEFDIAATQAPTRGTVSEGDILNFDITGTWSYNGTNWGSPDADTGYHVAPGNYPIPGGQVIWLTFRVGTTGTWFRAKSGVPVQIPVGRNGAVYWRINDAGLSDNQGTIHVKVSGMSC